MRNGPDRIAGLRFRPGLIAQKGRTTHGKRVALDREFIRSRNDSHDRGGVLVIVVRVMASRYKKIPPNTVGIFFGRRYKGPENQIRGFRIVAGGGSLLWPIVEQLQMMSTAAFQVEINEQGIPNRDNVKINVRGVASCKISNLEADLFNAAQAFLGKSEEEVQLFARTSFWATGASIIGKLSIDEILRNRNVFNRQVVDESTEELKRLGIQVITLVIQDVNNTATDTSMSRQTSRG